MKKKLQTKLEFKFDDFDGELEIPDLAIEFTKKKKKLSDIIINKKNVRKNNTELF